ncbi:MAG: hypothetical protein A3J93_00365 [Candidatus Magasanikbacteria bacterium RIFOXYC2_FULL_42_28]|uniref:Uncharacterized protein n=1 Tax=Candidatus Magasanikbacteria bacterium RIFOXYC2_FULL_42_28 TaxID=1798704 RepID=A0A1F6NW59_9BACT|nr:MAG: hypothetical protein A3J93_00365 [Candidatus Magasanikbacteria bacterium RIFOXYC2_FULL_42_28]
MTEKRKFTPKSAIALESENEMTPEELAELIKVELIPFSDDVHSVTTQKEAAGSYIAFNGFKWMIDKKNYNLKIWPSSTIPPLDHVMVDRKLYFEGTYGNISRSSGLEFRQRQNFTRTETAAIKLALEKFFGVEITYFIK